MPKLEWFNYYHSMELFDHHNNNNDSTVVYDYEFDCNNGCNNDGNNDNDNYDTNERNTLTKESSQRRDDMEYVQWHSSRSGLDGWISKLLTQHVLHLEVGEKVFWVSEDISLNEIINSDVIGEEECSNVNTADNQLNHLTFPPLIEFLHTIYDPWELERVLTFNHSESIELLNSGANNWLNLKDRLRMITELFYVYHSHPTVKCPLFTPEQREKIWDEHFDGTLEESELCVIDCCEKIESWKYFSFSSTSLPLTCAAVSFPIPIQFSSSYMKLCSYLCILMLAVINCFSFAGTSIKRTE